VAIRRCEILIHRDVDHRTASTTTLEKMGGQRSPPVL
jgi:hypothetical protein